MHLYSCHKENATHWRTKMNELHGGISPNLQPNCHGNEQKQESFGRRPKAFCQWHEYNMA